MKCACEESGFIRDDNDRCMGCPVKVIQDRAKQVTEKALSRLKMNGPIVTKLVNAIVLSILEDQEK